MEIKHVEVVFDDEDKQFAVFFIFENGSVVEKHYRKLPVELYEKMEAVYRQWINKVGQKQDRNGRMFIYGDFDYVLSMMDDFDELLKCWVYPAIEGEG